MSAVIEKPAKVVYTAKTRTTGGREKGIAAARTAASKSCSAIRGNVDVKIAVV